MLVGCGSTAQLGATNSLTTDDALGSAGESTPGALGGGLAGPASRVQGQVDASAPVGPGGAQGSGALRRPTVSRAEQVPTAGPSGLRAQAPVSGRGFTAKEIFLGFGTQDDVNGMAQNAGFGAGVTFGDTKAQVQAVLDYVNARGGILGRKAVPVFKDVSSAESAGVAGQAACTAWTQDRQVFAVLNPVVKQSNDTLYQCLKKARTPLLRFASGNTDAADYQTYEQYAPANASGARFAPALVRRLVAQKYFSGWDTEAGGPGSAGVKVGLVLLPKHKALQPLLLAELRAAGHAAVETFVAGESYSAADYQSAVLRFSNSDVTHVLSASSDILYFMTQAESQSYRPRYALTTWNQPGALLQIAAPARQLAGSLGVGYVPALDVDGANDPGDVSPATTLCRSLMEGAGQETSVRLTFLVMLAECEMVFLLKQVMSLEGSLTNEALRAGIDALGTRHASAMTFQTRLATGQHDGAAKTRDLAYVSACSCFRYAGPAVAL